MKKLIYIMLLLPMVAIAQTDTLNYVKTTTYKKAYDSLPANATNADVQVMVNYFDGLGRPVQSVTADAGGSGEDIIQSVEYDQYGRQVKEYMPYAMATSGTVKAPYRNNSITELLDFYDDAKYENTPNPYSEIKFENSPLGRIFEQAAPGEDWKLSGYNTNDSIPLTGSQILTCGTSLGNATTSGFIKVVNNILVLRLKTNLHYDQPLTGCSFVSNGISLSPLVLPNLELGPITDVKGESTGFRAVIQGSKLYYFPIAGATPNVIGLDATLSVDLTWYFGGGHTVKYDYQANVGGEVRRFKVGFPVTGNTEQTELLTSGFYASGQLYKNIVRDENWTPASGKNHTVEEFKDKQGRVVLKRTYSDSQSHDTYYVYDRFSNLSYVIPPLAADDIVITTENLLMGGTNYPWTKLALVDQQLADDYDTELSAYENEEILNLDLLDKYGGQGGFTISPGSGGNLSLALNIMSNDTLNLRSGIIVENIGAVKDQELGRLQGAGYDYTFHVASGDLVASGSGGIPPGVLNVFLTGDVPLEYSRNYPWTRLAKADEEVADDYEKAIVGLDNSQILNTYTANTYGAAGGINISIDDEDTVTVSLNLTSVTPLEMQTGALFQLDAFRRIADRELGTVSGTYNSSPYSYTLSIQNNSLYVTGSGQFTQLTMLDTRLSRPVYEIKTEVVEGLCYIYHYDKRNRVIEKKIPGKDWDYIIYDRLDRVVATQNPFLRQNGYWITTKYDVFDRVAYTARIADARTRTELQTYLDGLVNPLLNVIRTQNVSHTGQGLTLNYTGTVQPANSANIYTVNYYDDYSYDMASITVPIANHYGDTLTINTKGMMTGTKVRTLSTNFWETSITGYDEKGRGVWNHSKNGYLATEDISDTQLDFTGKPDNTRLVHKKDNLPDLIVTNHFEYDIAGRLLRQSQQAGSRAPEMIVYNKYDELGQLESKKVGDAYNIATGYNATPGLQTIDYTYNIRGWLKGINDVGANLNTSADLFAFAIKYNSGPVPLYNGNISETYWKSKTDNKLRSYNYEYDALNRLVSANYVGNYALPSYPAQIENYKEGPITYDKNGNIKTLERYGLKANNTIDKIDVLSYSYFPYSNQLRGVNDTADAAGFDNKATGSSDDYSYDADGNLKKDLNKGYGTIAQWETLYNHLNLPRQVKWGSSKHINYVYDANGVKLEKKVTDGANITTTLYDGGYVYKDNVLQYFPHGEGYVSVMPPVIFSGSSTPYYRDFEYIYQYKDHLGNVRLSYTKSITGNIEIVEEDNYYAFGMKHAGYNNFVTGLGNATAQKYKYNGKELQDELGLNVYDYGWRQYDPAIGRFMKIDRFAEKYYSVSPYTYATNNPVLYNDIAGDSIGVGKDLFSKFRNGVVAKRDGIIQDRQSRIDKLTQKGNTDKANQLTEKWKNEDSKAGSDMSIINETLLELDVLENSSQVYNLFINSKAVPEDANGLTSYDEINNSVDISLKGNFSMGTLAHELKHGYQFQTGALSLRTGGRAGILYDITDEYEAHNRGTFFGAYPKTKMEVQTMYSLPLNAINLNTSIDHDYTYGKQLSTTTKSNSIRGTAQKEFYINWQDDK